VNSKFSDDVKKKIKELAIISKELIGENVALSTWAGSNNLTTVGTITSGTWSGTAIALSNGGTGATNAAQARANLGLVIGTDVQAPLVAGTDYQIPLTAGTSYIVPNSSITAKTKIKITYDSKGLITAGSDATTADIAPSTDKNYITDIQLALLNVTSGTNTGDQTSIIGNAGTASKLATPININNIPNNNNKHRTKKCSDCNEKIHNQSVRCINCLATFRLRNAIRETNRPSLEQLEEDLRNSSFVQVGEKYGVSDNCIRKWIKQYRKTII
jgi:hypothetical protein